MILCFSITACARGFDSGMKTDASSENEDFQSPPQTPAPGPEESPVQQEPPFSLRPLLWEAVKPSHKAWSDHTYTVLNTQAQAISNAQDMDRFCPMYAELTTNQKLNAVGMLISAIVRYESNFNPTTRFHETTMGTDPVTGLPVYSEGLMQLSYQDTLNWKFCDFDWGQDKNLSPTDPRKTILDPYKNLSCGIRILARQVERRGKIVIDKGAYWAVIKEGGRYEKIDQIAALVSSLDFCTQ